MNILLWPQSLKRISIFEHSDAFNRVLYDDPMYRKCPQLGRNLYKRSLQLEELYISNFADARSFLEPYFNKQLNTKLPVWTQLKQISLTSPVISPVEDVEEINDLLQAAGKAARHMPLLEVMELYNADRTSAGAFTYARTADPGYVSTENTSMMIWKATWRLEMDHRVRQTWQSTVEKLTGSRLALVQEIHLSSYDGPINFLQNMMTGESIMNPSSCSRILKDYRALSVAP